MLTCRGCAPQVWLYTLIPFQFISLIHVWLHSEELPHLRAVQLLRSALHGHDYFGRAIAHPNQGFTLCGVSCAVYEEPTDKPLTSPTCSFVIPSHHCGRYSS